MSVPLIDVRHRVPDIAASASGSIKPARNINVANALLKRHCVANRRRAGMAVRREIIETAEAVKGMAAYHLIFFALRRRRKINNDLHAAVVRAVCAISMPHRPLSALTSSAIPLGGESMQKNGSGAVIHTKRATRPSAHYIIACPYAASEIS